MISHHTVRSFLDASRPGALILFSARGRETELGSGILFDQPCGELVCQRPQDISGFFRRWERALARGYYLAGYLTYELGYAVDKIKAPPVVSDLPLAWMGVFAEAQIVSPRSLQAMIHQPLLWDQAWPPYWLRPLQPALSFKSYQTSLQHIQRCISRGETYQVNYTFPLQTRLDGNEGALFLDMIRQQPVEYAAFIRGGGRTVLSLSPELFFWRQGSCIMSRPMKGTAARGANPARDQRVLRQFVRSEKERAENVMIVDLMRNDLSRLCETGTVRVPELFRVEPYRTVYQMTSTITGQLQSGMGWETIFRSLFPCGSVTGAPKIHTMEIIAKQERGHRGVYTGAVGYVAPSGDAVFNIPIRTLVVEERTRLGKFGVGSGVVADSKIPAEWQECHAKAECVSPLARNYQLIETLRWNDEEGFADLFLHLARLEASARILGLPFSKTAAQRKLAAWARKEKWMDPQKIRILLHGNGRIQMESQPWAGKPSRGQARVRLSPTRVHSRNLFLYHKTTHRELYNRERMQAQARGLADVLFRNENQAVTEGTIANLFIRQGTRWFTPPQTDGLLPGIERGKLLRRNDLKVVERRLFRRDLIAADEIRLSNSVRGFYPVQLVI